MNISTLRLKLKKGQVPTLRRVNEGEPIEAADLIVNDTFYENPSETNIGQPVTAKEVVLRMEYVK